MKGINPRNRHRGLKFETLETRQMLAASPLIGDYNDDGVVGNGDYVVWRENFGQSGDALSNRDPANVGAVGIYDFITWKTNFGAVREVEPSNRYDLHDGSFIPLRAGDSANSLIVPAGEVFTLGERSDYDHIEVYGTLRVSRDYDTTLRFVDLIVLPGGKLDMGTATDPVHRKVDFIVKDVPIDLEEDPWQLGNGIINLGTWNAYGRELDHTWTTISNELRAGDTKIVLADAPDGWQVGDELLLPDTSQMAGTVRRESTVRIAAIDGNTITLDKPLDFDHLAVRDPSGNVRVMPYVANASRNIVIRSENPAGTRGHTIQMEQSEADVRYVSFLGLGRTLAKPLDNAVKGVDGVVTPGTNQVARYAWHWHHVHPAHDAPEEHPHSGHLVGSFFDGSDIGKWGIVIHGTSDMHVADNITDRFTGAGIVTEDGNERRNVIERNLAMGSFGFGTRDDSKFSMLAKIPGGEGAGFWFHSSENYIRGNVSVNNNIGYAVLNMLHPQGFTPGTTPREFANNVALSNLRHGIEGWRVPPTFVVRDSILANNGRSQYLVGNGEPGSVNLVDTLLLAQGGVSIGISSNFAYASRLELTGGEILGCAVGTQTVKSYYHIDGTVLQNRINFDWRESQARPIFMMTIKDVVSTSLPGLPFKHFDTGPLLPFQSQITLDNNIGYRVLLKNWQQEGSNYVFYRDYAKPSLIATGNLPEQGLTNAELWDKYGMSMDGGPMPTTAVPLADSDGYVQEFFGDTPQIDLPVSRWILIAPNAAVSTPRTSPMSLTFIYTGAPADINQTLEIDGQLVTLNFTPKSYAQDVAVDTFAVRLSGKGVWNAPGWHTVKTWRTLDGARIDGSEMEFTYFVGDALPKSA